MIILMHKIPIFSSLHGKKIILAPSVSPQVTVKRLSGTNMTVSWTKLTLAEARGFILNFTIVYYPSSGNRKWQQLNTMSVTVGNNSNNITINGLEENSVYSVQVSANTVAGRGALSMPYLVPLHGKKLTSKSTFYCIFGHNYYSKVDCILLCFS